MSHTIITPDTATDKVLELPLEAVILIGDPEKVSLATVLQRTGSDGWLITRHSAFPEPPGRYLNTVKVRETLRQLEEDGVDFILLYPGRSKGF